MEEVGGRILDLYQCMCAWQKAVKNIAQCMATLGILKALTGVAVP